MSSKIYILIMTRKYLLYDLFSKKWNYICYCHCRFTGLIYIYWYIFVSFTAFVEDDKYNRTSIKQKSKNGSDDPQKKDTEEAVIESCDREHSPRRTLQHRHTSNNFSNQESLSKDEARRRMLSWRKTTKLRKSTSPIINSGSNSMDKAKVPEKSSFNPKSRKRGVLLGTKKSQSMVKWKAYCKMVCDA